MRVSPMTHDPVVSRGKSAPQWPQKLVPGMVGVAQYPQYCDILTRSTYARSDRLGTHSNRAAKLQVRGREQGSGIVDGLEQDFKATASCTGSVPGKPNCHGPEM
eukprot:3386583-Rhodomonas_salina.5